MKRINLPVISIIVSVLIFAIVIVIVFVSISNYSMKVDEKKLVDMKNTVLSYAVQCYALEGHYPPDVAYLEQNYGLQLDTDTYVYHYDLFASNILPHVAVLQKDKAGE